MKYKKPLLITLTILTIVLWGLGSSFAQEDPTLDELSQLLDSFPYYHPSELEALKVEVTEALLSGVPGDVLLPIIRTSLERGVDIKDLTKLIDNLSRAARRGIPPQALLDKVQEGLAKGVDLDQIFIALVDRTGKLEIARGLVDIALKKGLRIRRLDTVNILTENIAEVLGREILVEEISYALEAAIRNNQEAEYISRIMIYWLSVIDKGVTLTDSYVLIQAVLDANLTVADTQLLFQELLRSPRASLDTMMDKILYGLASGLSIPQILNEL